MLQFLRCSSYELWTTVYPSNMAPIGLKLWENAFQTICNFRFLTQQHFFDEIFRCRKDVFRHFRWILEELGDFWRQNLIPWRILLQVHNFLGLYDSWSSVSSFVRSKNLANFNFAKAGARPDGGTARHGRGPSLGKIKIWNFYFYFFKFDLSRSCENLFFGIQINLN